MTHQTKKTTGGSALTQDELYHEIIEYLEINNICTLAFACNNVPRATPVEYRNDGAQIYVVSEGMSHRLYQAGEKHKVVEWKKMFIERNPRCCVGIISPYFGYRSKYGRSVVSPWRSAGLSVLPPRGERSQ